MKKIYVYSLILILLILQSCAFEPKGEAFETIDPTGIAPDIQINLNLAGDTLFIPINSTVTFVYGLENEKIIRAQFIINGLQTEQINFESPQGFIVKVF